DGSCPLGGQIGQRTLRLVARKYVSPDYRAHHLQSPRPASGNLEGAAPRLRLRLARTGAGTLLHRGAGPFGCGRGRVRSERQHALQRRRESDGAENNVARMAALLSGLPETVPAVTVNRLCASGLEAVGQAARAIAGGDAQLVIAGGVESMSRAPFVIAKAETAFGREQKLEDSTLGWRCINPVMQARYGVDSMMQTADNL